MLLGPAVLGEARPRRNDFLYVCKLVSAFWTSVCEKSVPVVPLLNALHSFYHFAASCVEIMHRVKRVRRIRSSLAAVRWLRHHC